MITFLLFVTGMGFVTGDVTTKPRPPNIVFILADDLGWNDVSFHGSQQIPTPNLDSLAKRGIILNNYYVSPICSPSRSALMTGKHPIHTGMQHDVIYGPQPYGLPLKEKLLPAYLKELGYSTHIVGKWHLGFFKTDYTPIRRGFDTHFGYYCGHQDYYDHTSEEAPEYWGFDMRRDEKLVPSTHGVYSTDLFTEEAVQRINRHDKSKPMFLYLAHLAVHAGNSYMPLQAPYKYIKRFPHIKDYRRRTFAGMVAGLDDSVGAVVQALHNNSMLENSIIVFSTDNGGPVNGYDGNAASNWPLRGCKHTLWEGGVRGAAFIWSPLLETRERVSTQLMHISDWLPTLNHAAGGDPSSLPPIDGVDMWDALSKNTMSPRTEVLHNIDDLFQIAALRVGDYKVVIGNYNQKYDGWFPPWQLQEITPEDQTELADMDSFQSVLHAVLEPFQRQEILNDNEAVMSAQVKCDLVPTNASTDCQPQMEPCLFNIKEDPCEFHNLAKEEPSILANILDKLIAYNATAIPPGNKPDDPASLPRLHGYNWVSWMDEVDTSSFPRRQCTDNFVTAYG